MTNEIKIINSTAISENKDKLDDLLQAGDFSEAFFIARRLVAEGEDWAEEYMQNAGKRFD